MDTLKQLFAFPVYATAAWLLWVVAQQTSPFGLGAALAGAHPHCAGGLVLPEIQVELPHGGRMAALATAVISVLLAIILPVRFADVAAAVAQRFTPAARGRGRVAAVRRGERRGAQRRRAGRCW